MRLDLLPRQAGGYGLADGDRDCATAVDEAATPQPSAVECNRNHGQSERAIKRREARLQRGRLAYRHARPFRINEDAAPARNRLLPLLDKRAKRFRTCLPLDRDDAITPRQEAEKGNVGEL